MIGVFSPSIILNAKKLVSLFYETSLSLLLIFVTSYKLFLFIAKSKFPVFQYYILILCIKKNYDFARLCDSQHYQSLDLIYMRK